MKTEVAREPESEIEIINPKLEEVKERTAKLNSTIINLSTRISIIVAQIVGECPGVAKDKNESKSHSYNFYQDMHDLLDSMEHSVISINEELSRL